MIQKVKISINFSYNFLRHFFIGPNTGHHNDSSCSSGPDSPHITTNHSTDGSTPSRAQYVSASCVVFTHYSGDTASTVDEHFSRALNFSNKESKGKSFQ